MFTTLMTEANALTHGWSGLVFGYATTAGPMLAGLIRERVPLRKILQALVISPTAR